MSDVGESGISVHVVPTLAHGRALVREARAAVRKGILVGFHGYAENAAVQMDRLVAIAGSEAWTLVSIQGLHRFYRGRSEDVVASWMTREDRDEAIADNLSYVSAALERVPHDHSTRVVYAGFSQGVAMAFRAGVAGRERAAGIIGVGGDVPPELIDNNDLAFPAVLLLRGLRDEWLTAARFDRDVASLTARHVALTASSYGAGHEWTPEVSTAIGGFLRQISSAKT